jgi:hypothetical protein
MFVGAEPAARQPAQQSDVALANQAQAGFGQTPYLDSHVVLIGSQLQSFRELFHKAEPAQRCIRLAVLK